MKYDIQINSNGLLNNFDLLRFLLASIVFLVHSSNLSAVNELKILESLSSSFAVKSFFVVSGFLIFMSYENSSSSHRYFIKRLRRIYPAYFTVVILSSLVGFFFSTLPIREYFCLDLIKYLVFNLIFLNFLHPNLPGLFEHNTLSAVNGALWTLKIEVMFYISVPLIVLLFNKLNRLFVLATIYISSFVYSFCMIKLAEAHGGGIFIELQRQLPGQLMYFLVGAAGYYYYEYFRTYSKVLLGFAVICFIIKPLLPWLVIEPVVLGILVLFLALALPYLGNFTKYGDFSYGIYIVHFPVLQVLIAYNLFDAAPVLAIIFAAFSVLLLSFLLWNLVEKPFLQKSSHYLTNS